MAITMIREVLKTTGITATVGIGTNLYLAKVAMDIVAKKQPADKDGVRIDLTSVEFKILSMFMEHPGKVFTRQQILERGWGEEYSVADNNIMVCISKLRVKLSEDPSAYIRTIRGLGYRLER